LPLANPPLFLTTDRWVSFPQSLVNILSSIAVLRQRDKKMDSATQDAVPLSWPSRLDEEDSDRYDDDPETTLESIVKSKTINFSICASYTNWKPREAFRELVQNW
jgi:hypothetical protein